VSAPVGQATPTLWGVYDHWLRRATVIISESADALNVMNVFPVSDSDTGSNLKLTLAGIAQAVPDVNRASLDAIVQAAILSAHGNSGAILAEMFTSVCRALEQRRAQLRSAPAGELVAVLLRTVAKAARRAVARPVAGTILTVADAAADAAEEALPDQLTDALGVARRAQRGAREALARTPEQLEVLAAAGVVDAGGQAYTLLLDVLVEVLGGDQAQSLTEVAPDEPRRAFPFERPPLEYEVMYAVRDAGPADLDELREELSVLGHSVVIVGDHAVAQVHVHLTEAGAAVEAALGRGRLSQIRITALPPDAAAIMERTVLSVVAGPGLAEAVTSLGGIPVLAADRTDIVADLTAAAEQGCRELVILPNDMETLEVAAHLATDLRRQGRRVAVIPTVAQMQGLAAMAVHEPSADFESVVVTMSSAAGHARHAAVTVAESPAMTMAGRCETGDVLGVIEGDFVEIGDSVADVAWSMTQRLLTAGGELLTLVAGADAEPGLIASLAERIRTQSRGIDVEVLDGGQSRYLLLIGLE
jgi:DAK2 domain fusion protein YloV